MGILAIILRLVHIFGGVYWVGASFFMMTILGPAAAATGETGKQFMQHLSLRSRMSDFIGAAAALTFISGFALYWWLSDFSMGWISSPYGLTLTLGAIAGTIAWVYGFFAHGMKTKHMRALAAEMAAADGPPKPEQIAKMQQMAGEMQTAGLISFILVSLALIGMSIAQYVSG